MRISVVFAVWMAGAHAQVPSILPGSFNTDQQIKLYQDWVQKDPASISNRTLLAGAYIQKDPRNH